mmetsp:Transcript_87003/g.218996  ORF Transcript_87003/g.218996 Transcript_87003/m.218996 type:complete len:482 (+) Transcript_87003:55-1500(+)|eukprot:CAMPEP_0115393794 /NCGR_PEP_ID=MMETSP0271-20121206/11935_1 /TAXON_ID=71861 /ORGANISM="Scrippsiella trochoidea, Strain CCMP3099" /LENGTH=481 /DNA_ID=CAMNT_0002817447 /DNA_START=46 /DNA_END=1491 /DNA_ORIENTATION=+
MAVGIADEVESHSGLDDVSSEHKPGELEAKWVQRDPECEITDGSTCCSSHSSPRVTPLVNSFDAARPASALPIVQNNHCLHIDGADYPSFWNKDEIVQLRRQWRPKAGDVFIANQFPIRGIQRLLVSLIEGNPDPWSAGLLKKPHFCDAAASKRGAAGFMDEADKWEVRRCFKTVAMPNSLPCQYPFEDYSGEGLPPKILVLIADPRHAFIVWWQFITTSCARLNVSIPEFIEKVVFGEFKMFGNYFEHAKAWAQEAAQNPGSVRIADAGRLGSLDPKEVKAELEDIADFLDIPRERVADLVVATFRRPRDADLALKQDDCVMHEALNGGHLVEQTGLNLHLFEEAVNSASMEVHTLWINLLKTWIGSSSSQLAQLAEVSMRGVSSTLPAALTFPLKGEAAHESGRCRPCVFHLRGICRNTEEMCLYCHAPGHAKTKRASLKVRQRQKAKLQRGRSPSPSPQNLALPYGKPFHPSLVVFGV